MFQVRARTEGRRDFLSGQAQTTVDRVELDTQGLGRFDDRQTLELDEQIGLSLMGLQALQDPLEPLEIRLEMQLVFEVGGERRRGDIKALMHPAGSTPAVRVDDAPRDSKDPSPLGVGLRGAPVPAAVRSDENLLNHVLDRVRRYATANDTKHESLVLAIEALEIERELRGRSRLHPRHSAGRRGIRHGHCPDIPSKTYPMTTGDRKITCGSPAA